MNEDSRVKATLSKIQEDDLQHPFLSAANILIDPDEVEIKTTAEADSELNDSLRPSSVQMAAALVEQAMQGRWMPLEVAYHKHFHRARQAFILYHKLYPARTICYFVLVLLPFFEIPGWCHGELPHPCGDPKKYALSGIPYVQRWLSVLIEILCLVMLVISMSIQCYYLGPSFWKHHVAVYKIVLLSAVIATAVGSALGIPEAIQLSMYLRVLIPMVFTRALRVCFRMTTRIVHTFADLAVLLVLFVLVSGYLVTFVFREAFIGFEDYGTAILNLLILLTTANNPNVWVDAYTADRRAFFFFFTFLVVGLFFLMNLVFTVIYSNYKLQMASEVVKRTTIRQQSLRAAFNLLDSRQQNWIDGATMIALFHAMNIHRHFPDFHTNKGKVFMALDKRGDFKIWQDEFEGLCDVIAMEVERQPQTLRQSSSGAAEIIRALSWFQFVTQPVYDRLIWVLTLVSVVVAICESETKSESWRSALKITEFVLGWIFVLDSLVKISSCGWEIYWRNNLNRFDFIFAVLVVTVESAACLQLVGHQWVSLLFIARALRLCSFMTLISRWHLMAQTLFHLIPATAPILVLQFLVCSLFSLVGVHIFGGKVYVGNPLLVDTEYANARFHAFNYNDYASAMITSFNLCLVNNWFVFMDAYVAVTGTGWTRSFFISFWAVAVAFTLNVLVAFFVEAFVNQMEKAQARNRDESAPVSSGILANETVLAASKTVWKAGLRKEDRIIRSFSCYDLYEDMVRS